MERVRLDLNKGLNLSASDLSEPFTVTRLPLWPKPGLNWVSHPGHDVIATPVSGVSAIDYSDPSGIVVFDSGGVKQVADLPAGVVVSGDLDDWAFIPRLGLYRNYHDGRFIFVEQPEPGVTLKTPTITTGTLEAGQYYIWALSFSKLRGGLFLRWYNATYVSLSSQGGIRIELSEPPGDNRVVNIYVQRLIGNSWSKLAFLKSLTGQETKFTYSAHTQEGEFVEFAIPRGSNRFGAYWNGRYFYLGDELAVLGAQQADVTSPAPPSGSVYGYINTLNDAYTPFGFGALALNSSPTTLDYGVDWTASVTTSEGTFIAVQRSGNTEILHSKDGLRLGWRKVYTTTSQLTAAVASNDRVVFLGPGIAVSAELTQERYLNPNMWQTATLPGGTPIDAVFSGTQFAAITSNQILTSPNGLSWQVDSPPPSLFEDREFVQVAYAQGRFITMTKKPLADGYYVDFFTYAGPGTWTKIEGKVRLDFLGVEKNVHGVVFRRFAYLFAKTVGGVEYIYWGSGIKGGWYWTDGGFALLDEKDYHVVYRASDFLSGGNTASKSFLSPFTSGNTSYGQLRKLPNERFLSFSGTCVITFPTAEARPWGFAESVRGVMVSPSVAGSGVIVHGNGKVSYWSPGATSPQQLRYVDGIARVSSGTLVFVGSSMSDTTKFLYRISSSVQYSLLPPAPHAELGALVQSKARGVAEENGRIIVARVSQRAGGYVLDVLKTPSTNISNWLTAVKLTGKDWQSPLPGIYAKGDLVWLPVVDLATNNKEVIEVNVATGAYRTFNLGSEVVVGIAHDGTNAFVATNTKKIYKLDNATQTLTQVYSSANNITGLASSSGKIFFGEGNTIYSLNTSTNTATSIGTVATGYSLSHGEPNGTNHLFVAKASDGTESLYLYDGTSLGLVYSSPSGGRIVIPSGGSGGGSGDNTPASSTIKLPQNTMLWTLPGYINLATPYSWHTFVSRSSRTINEMVAHPSGVLVFMDNEVFVATGKFTSVADTRIAPYPAPIGLDRYAKLAVGGSVVYVPWGGRLYALGQGDVVPISTAVDDGVPIVAVALDAKVNMLVVRKSDGRALRYDLIRKVWFNDMDDALDIAHYYDGASSIVIYVSTTPFGSTTVYSLFTGGEPSINYKRPAQEIWIEALKLAGEPIKRLRAVYIDAKGQGSINASLRIYNEDETEVANQPMVETIASNTLGLGRYRAVFPPVVSYAPRRMTIAFAGVNLELSPYVEVHYEKRMRKV